MSCDAFEASQCIYVCVREKEKDVGFVTWQQEVFNLFQAPRLKATSHELK